MNDTAGALTAAVAERAITAASRAIDKHCGYPLRKFWLDDTATSKVYRPDDPYEAWIHDLGSVDDLVVATDTGDNSYSTVWDSADYQLEPLNADVAGDSAYAWWRLVAVDEKTFPIGRYRPTLRVTAKWGWSEIPEDVDQACLIKAAALYERRNSPDGIHSVDGFGAVRVNRFDPDVLELLGPFQREHVGAI